MKPRLVKTPKIELVIKAVTKTLVPIVEVIATQLPKSLIENELSDISGL